MRTLLSLVLFFSLSVPALASCPSSLELKDANGVTAPGKYTDDGSGNCQVNTAEQDGAQATIGSKSDSAYGGSGSGSLVTLLKGIYGVANSAIPAQSNTTTTIGQVGGQVNITPTDCSGTISSGGTAQSLISANSSLHGFTLQNIDASAGSGEDIWFSLTTTAAASTAQSYGLIPPASTTTQGGSYTTPLGLGTNHAVSIIAATTGHKFSCTYW